MKKILITGITLFIITFVQAQVTIKGIVTDENQKPLNNATVKLIANKKESNALSTNDGSFEFTNVETNAKVKLVVLYTGRKTKEESFIADADKTFSFTLGENEYFLEPLEVKAIRAADKAPFTKTNISKQQIEEVNLGQDIPFILNQTPSVTVTSDAGNGVGYTAIRIRGTDATRINVTLNGIPYNDAESQITYFVDLPDFVSSVNSIQVQRGAGTSTNGAGAFGATINLSTNELNEKAYGEINNSYGSFSTWKNTIRAGSGLLNNHFTIDARLSRITSDGYIDRAFSNLQSFYASGAFINQKTSLRLNIFSGKEKTYQAWYGITKDILETDRTYNPAGTERPGQPYNNQTDNYRQTHYQLFFNQALNNNLSLNIATFLTRGKGYYEEYKASQPFSDYSLNNVIINNDTITATDLIRQLWLDNYFYGQTFALQYKQPKDEITFGGSWTKYDGKHFGKIIWANIGVPDDYEYYRFCAVKTDFNVYAKWLRQINVKWNLFGDIQYRHVSHEMNGFEDNPALFIKRNFNFINPKAGISYSYNGLLAFISYALANKEPGRDDFEASIIQQPTNETLHDFEFGIERKQTKYNWAATLYYMMYRNQLVLTGKINDVGSYTRINVPNSYRAGLELQGAVASAKWFSASGNITISTNKIKSFTEYLDNYDDGLQKTFTHRNTDISFSPSVIASAAINLYPIKNFEISLPAKYVGKQYLDNTQNELRKLDAYYVQDVRVNYKLQNILSNESNIILQINNIFNCKYEPNGYTYPYIYNGELINENYYYPMAGINFMIGLNIKL